MQTKTPIPENCVIEVYYLGAYRPIDEVLNAPKFKYYETLEQASKKMRIPFRVIQVLKKFK